jgi:hypothetical protein
MAIKAEILADSISPAGVRLTTLLCEYPRFIHSELMTHRVFSRNAASSRAIPPEKQIQRIIDDPFVPVFGSRVAGMGEGELDDLSQDAARRTWLLARDSAVDYAKVLNKLGTDKSRINRLLEPFSWITVIITATEWSNFFALRDHPAAQGEFQQLARAMREAMDVHTPRELRHGQWHLPLVKIGGRTTDWEVAKKLCVSRGALVFHMTSNMTRSRLRSHLSVMTDCSRAGISVHLNMLPGRYLVMRGL